MGLSAFSPLCLHIGGSEGLCPMQVYPHAQMLTDAQLGEGPVDKSSLGPPQSQHGAKKLWDILHA